MISFYFFNHLLWIIFHGRCIIAVNYVGRLFKVYLMRPFPVRISYPAKGYDSVDHVKHNYLNFPLTKVGLYLENSIV